MPFAFLLAAMLLFNFFIFLTPYLASMGDEGTAGMLQVAFGPTCHQLTSRSLCLFKSKADGGYSIADCFPSSELSYSRVNQVDYPDKTGYKIPVCARDIAIYLAMLLGLILLPLLQKIESENWPSRWILVAACVPIGLDGGFQLIGIHESTNLLRLITGAIVGLALPFYILPIMNSLYIFLQEKLRKPKGGHGKV